MMQFIAKKIRQVWEAPPDYSRSPQIPNLTKKNTISSVTQNYTRVICQVISFTIKQVHSTLKDIIDWIFV